MKHLLRILLLATFVANSNLTFSQLHDHTWILGAQYGTFGQHNNAGLIKIPFSEGEMLDFEWVNDSLNYFPYSFNYTGTIMSDAEGDLVFYYNGFQIRDHFNQVPIGGDTLNEYWFWNSFTGSFNNGIPIKQSSLALPVPGYEDEYIILSTTADIDFINIGQVVANKIFVHRVKNTVSGLDVLYSNNTILNDEKLTPGGLTAVRHANGRDWWVMFGRVSDNLEYLEGFYQYLLTPYGLEYQQYNAFDFPVYGYGSGQFCYNQDGTKMIMATVRLYTHPFNLIIFDFDRCTGVISNMIIKESLEDGISTGCAVSPNNKYLYVSNAFQVYQYDLEAEDIFATEQLIGEVDPSILHPFFIAIAGNAQLAPDGKIYFANGNSTTALNVIHYPDSAGLASGFEQGGFELGVYNFRTIPNFPNYCLGAMEGSPCDTLGWTYDNCKVDSMVSVQEVAATDNYKLQIHPNPSTGATTLSLPEAGRLSVYDLQGRLMQQTFISSAELELNYHGNYTLHTTGLPAGMYVVVHYGESGEVYRGKLAVVPY